MIRLLMIVHIHCTMYNVHSQSRIWSKIMDFKTIKHKIVNYLFPLWPFPCRTTSVNMVFLLISLKKRIHYLLKQLTDFKYILALVVNNVTKWRHPAWNHTDTKTKRAEVHKYAYVWPWAEHTEISSFHCRPQGKL